MKKYLILLILLFSTSAWSATYYIDYVGGADTNNGTTTGTPFKHCPGDNLAANTALATTLAGDDIIIFKGGVAYNNGGGKIDLDWSGTSGHLITYDGNSAGTWGTGKAIIEGAGASGGVGVDEEAGFYASVSRNYITIQNFEIRGMGGGAVNTSCSDLHQIDGYGVFFSGGGTYITVKDCYIHDIGDWENKAYAHQGYMEGMAVYFAGTSGHITVDNVEVSEIGRGAVYFVSSGTTPLVTNIEVKNCTIHKDVRWGIYFGANTNSTTFQDINIHNNAIHNIGDGTTWLGCSGAYLHNDGVMLTPNSYAGHTLGTAAHPVRIHSNNFYNSITTSYGTADIFMTAWGGTTYIYNNIFNNPRSVDATIYAQGMSADSPADYHIMNNSFYGNRVYIMIRDLGGVSFSGRTAVDVVDNVFYYDGTGAALAVTAYGIPMSYFTSINNNIFYTKRTDGLIGGSTEAGVKVYKTVATLNALDNADGNVSGNPLYTNTSYGIGTNSASNVLSLQGSSPAINIGTDLSSYFTTDYLGEARPTGASTWDAGAYEYGPSGASPPVFDSITATPANGTIYYSQPITLSANFSENVDSTDHIIFTLNDNKGTTCETATNIANALGITCTVYVTKGQSATNLSATMSVKGTGKIYPTGTTSNEMVNFTPTANLPTGINIVTATVGGDNVLGSGGKHSLGAGARHYPN
jgi:hypothetical protein